MDTCSIFSILGATYGINFALKYLKNPYYWQDTSLILRFIRGIIGFVLFYTSLYLISVISTSLTNAYVFNSMLNVIISFLIFGILPVLFDYLHMNNLDDKEIIRRYYKLEKNKILTKEDKVDVID